MNWVGFSTSSNGNLVGKKTKIHFLTLRKFRAIKHLLIEQKLQSTWKKSIWAWRKAWHKLLQRSARFQDETLKSECRNWSETRSSPGPNVVLSRNKSAECFMIWSIVIPIMMSHDDFALNLSEKCGCTVQIYPYTTSENDIQQPKPS